MALEIVFTPDSWPRSLEKLAARVIEQAGVLQIGSTNEASFIKIKKFADQFISADSHAEDVTGYEAELTVVMDEVKVSRWEAI